MVKAYKVAECVFHLEIPDSPVLVERLGQYAPFETSLSDTPVFTLSLVKGMDERPMTVAYDVPVEPGEAVVKLWRGEDFWQYETAPCSEVPMTGKMRSSLDFKKAELMLLSRRMNDVIFSINNALMLLFAFRTASMGVLEMHASVVVNSGKAFLFLAKSGTGKSTHSSLWLKHIPGSELLNDDNPVVRIWPDGRIIAYGSPWSGKTPCYRNAEAPVGAFVRIRRCEENKITRLSILEGYALVYSSCSGFKSDKEMADDLHSTIEKAVLGAPCYVLDCRPDEEAARVSSAELLGKA